MNTEVFFLPAGDGQRFCLYHPAVSAPGGGARGQVVYVHPFAEEMNKSRRMAALQARALSAAGFDVLQIDLLGCGDSSGDSGDATWAAWVHDVTLACHWLRGRAGAQVPDAAAPPLWLWGLRSGCLVATQAARALAEPCNFLFWAPTASGKAVLQQFLRLKAAANLADGSGKAVLVGLRSDLAQGKSVEVAGYQLSSALASGLEAADLTAPAARQPAPRMEWFELSTRPDASLSPVALQTIGQWQSAGYAVGSHLARGPAFWQTSEIEDAPELVQATTQALLGTGAGADAGTP